MRKRFSLVSEQTAILAPVTLLVVRVEAGVLLLGGWQRHNICVIKFTNNDMCARL